MRVFQAYRLRLQRRKWQIRAFRKRRELRLTRNNLARIAPQDVLLVMTVRNEKSRLPFFLKYYRDLGVGHFLIVDNASDDGTGEYLAEQQDVSLWHTAASYKRSRFGADWLNWILRRHCRDHWILAVDADEFFVYPFCDTRPIQALTDWLDASSIRSFGAMLLDMYPKGSFLQAHCAEGQDPIELACWFDSGNYMIEHNAEYGNLWIQGGPRARAFFADRPEKAPALNKIPLVKWQRGYAFVSSTHMLLPRGLNLVYENHGGEKASGCLLHAKFLSTIGEKSAEEMQRREHYSSSIEYDAYYRQIGDSPDLWTKWSEKYINWRQLEILGLMSKGNWA